MRFKGDGFHLIVILSCLLLLSVASFFLLICSSCCVCVLRCLICRQDNFFFGSNIEVNSYFPQAITRSIDELLIILSDTLCVMLLLKHFDNIKSSLWSPVGECDIIQIDSSDVFGRKGKKGNRHNYKGLYSRYCMWDVSVSFILDLCFHGEGMMIEYLDLYMKNLERNYGCGKSIVYS